MQAVKIARLAQLPPGSLEHVTVGKREFAVCNVQGEIFAIDGRCPHAGAPLGHGNLDGYSIICPFHAWDFDCRTGELGGHPRVKVQTYAVRVQDGEIYIEVPQ